MDLAALEELMKEKPLERQPAPDQTSGLPPQSKMLVPKPHPATPPSEVETERAELTATPEKRATDDWPDDDPSVKPQT